MSKGQGEKRRGTNRISQCQSKVQSSWHSLENCSRLCEYPSPLPYPWPYPYPWWKSHKWASNRILTPRKHRSIAASMAAAAGKPQPRHQLQPQPQSLPQFQSQSQPLTWRWSRTSSGSNTTREHVRNPVWASLTLAQIDIEFRRSRRHQYQCSALTNTITTAARESARETVSFFSS